ncbi:inorganic diphosphatase [Methanosphaera sp.]|uniref:inorganic diphosphatase n=1 Tax=Methanosphaera sp. TaxID=2666342 RepID=UPI0025D05A86|nr:inorganic diphosphatase [Methanosphaera sp.]MEE1116855.1 inorganic diphosphatase [Methanosphaera sp.]MEE3324485.1 inorganic diphosphatase [Methanosphaera sp.]MEE3417989.1 inorganic diphosphatase [Methanosphaera sp.]
MNLWTDIESGSNVPEEITVVVEIPTGSRNKYEYDKEKEALALDRVLFSPFHYPAEYGFMPKSLWEDGDPFDVMVIMDQPTFPGCIIEARPIGIMRMIDQGDSDDKLLAVPVEDPRFADITDISQLPEHYLKEIEHFFSQYKALENKTVEVKGWEDNQAAKEAVLHAIELYKEKYE